MVNQTPKELNDYGDKYFYGDGLEKNIEMAFTYYKKAADLNNPIGYYNVGKYFFEKEQYKEAVEYFNKARELGYTKAAIKLSELYLNGYGLRKSKKKAFKMLSQAVEANDIMAIHQLGKFYWEGIGCKKDEKNALKYFELSSENKVPQGMYLLGSLYLEAKQIKKDFENGFFWLDKAAENGEINAIKKLIDLYHNSHPYLKKKSMLYLKEMEFYYKELLAKKGDKAALEEVSYGYYEGNEYTKVNYEKSNIYFNELCRLDQTKGYLGLGLSYLYGKGVEIDYIKAKELLEIASTRSDLVAMNALGDIYRLGYGVDLNYQRAKDYYFEAAKSNETNALINLGLLNYRKQISGAKNELAKQYMMTASEKGNKLAHYWLGIFYEKGIGCERNLKLAESEYKKAIEANNEGAKYKYAQMLYENSKVTKMSNKKKNLVFLEVRDLLIEYINSPITSDVNTLYSMYMLGDIYQLKSFSLKSDKISRYYYELAATKSFTKAMVRMYFLLIEKEPEVAINYLKEAIKHPADGEALFEMGNLLYDGHELMDKDIGQAKEFYGKAAALNYQLAKEKLGMM